MFLLKDVIFSKNECNSLVNSITEFTEAKLYYKGDGGDMKPAIITSQRKALSSESPLIKDSSVYNQLNVILKKVGYKLNSDTLNYNIVKYKEGHFIHSHKDGGEIFMTFVVQLSEPSEYTGGDFVYWINDEKHTLDKEIGYGIIIGPEIQHEVTMVTSGERNSFVLFLEYTNVLPISKQALI